MGTSRICSGCGKPLASNAPQGLCPQCLLKAGLGSGVDIGPDTQSGSGRITFVAPALEEIARLFPQLEILGFVGQGGMGAVYRARQRELDRVVALKILPPDIGRDAAFAERFTREARAMAKLNHPGIVTLYEFGRADGLFFFLMEFVEGVNLDQLLEGSHLSSREALALVPQICDALQYAHDQGIVHRDIKPQNILVDRRGRVKVADFGLAKIVGQASSLSRVSSSAQESGKTETGATPVLQENLTEAGKVMGTPQYMAPEQREHPTEVDHRADIYSLGVVFYQMLTGELPGKPVEAPSSRLRGMQIDVRLDEVVLRAIEKEPERRYQQASQVKTDVETIASSPPSPGTAPKPNHWEIGIIASALTVYAFLLVLIPTVSPPFRHLLVFLCAVGLSICGLTLAGWWPAPSFLVPDSGFSRRNLHQVGTLSRFAFISACLSCLIPVLCWLAPWVFPRLSLRGQEWMLWLGLSAAFVAVVTGIGARQTGLGKSALVVGLINVSLLGLSAVTGRSPATPFSAYRASRSSEGDQDALQTTGLTDEPRAMTLGHDLVQSPGAGGTGPGKQSTSAAQAKPGEFKVTLENGLTLEVVAVGRDPRGSNSWWQPDGTPLAEPPVDVLELPKLVPTRQSQVTVIPQNEFLFYIRRDVPPGMVIESFQPGFTPRPSDVEFPATVLEIGSNTRASAQLVCFAEPPDTADYQECVACGPWESVSVYDAKTKTTRDLERGVMALWSEPRYEHGALRFDVMHNADRERFALRMVARLQNGGSEKLVFHPGILTGAPAKGFALVHGTEHKVENWLQQVKEMVIERTPWVRGGIPNIRLRPRELTASDTPAAEAATRHNRVVTSGFGEVMERVLHDPDDRPGHETLNLAEGSLSSELAGAEKLGGGGIRRLVESGGDLFAEFDDWVGGSWALVTAGLQLGDMLPRHWESAAAAEIERALAAPTAVPRIERHGAILYLLPEGLTPMTFGFKTRHGETGLLQVTGFTDNPRGVKLRYRLVPTPGMTRKTAASMSEADRARAVALFNDIEDFGHEFEAAFASTNLAAAQTGVRRLLDMLANFNTVVRGTDCELPTSLLDDIGKVQRALAQGDWENGRRLGRHNEAYAREFRRIGAVMAALARETYASPPEAAIPEVNQARTSAETGRSLIPQAGDAKPNGSARGR